MCLMEKFNKQTYENVSEAIAADGLYGCFSNILYRW